MNNSEILNLIKEKELNGTYKKWIIRKMGLLSNNEKRLVDTCLNSQDNYEKMMNNTVL